MLNMIKLDWSSMKYFHRRFLIIPICLIITGWFSPIILIPMGVFLLFFFSINLFAIEEKGDLNRLYLTLPIRRNTIVTSRYALALLLYIVGVLLAFALMPFANLISSSKWYPDYKWILVLFSFSFLLHTVMSLSMYPLLFKLGYQKGKFWGLFLPAIIFSLIFISIIEYDITRKNGTLMFDLLVYTSEHLLLVSGGMFALGTACLTASYLLSNRLYAKREF